MSNSIARISNGGVKRKRVIAVGSCGMKKSSRPTTHYVTKFYTKTGVLLWYRRNKKVTARIE